MVEVLIIVLQQLLEQEVQVVVEMVVNQMQEEVVL